MSRRHKLFRHSKESNDGPKSDHTFPTATTLKLDELCRIDSRSSVDTNATAPNLPGPGRTVGLLLDTLGAGLENFVNKFAERHGVPTASSPLLRADFRDSSRTDVASLDASDATASNLTGAGRTVGLLFDSLGSSVERIANKIANRYGAGPGAIGQNIRQLRRHQVTLVYQRYNEELSRPEERALGKLCKKLLKYSRAQLLQTQLKALEEITHLAVSDPHIRRVLDNYRVEHYLAPAYSEPQLHLASAKALISIKNNEVHTVWSRFRYLTSETPLQTIRNNEITALSNSIKRLIKDPDVSFLMARHMIANGSTLGDPRAQNIWANYLGLTWSDPQVVEWDHLNSFFASQSLDPSSYPLLRWLTFYLLRPGVARRIPAFFSQEVFRTPSLMSDGGLNADATEFNSSLLWQFLADLCGSSDLMRQIFFFRSFDVDMQYLLKDTILGNEMLIAYVHLHHSFTEKVDPFWPDELNLDPDAELEDEEIIALSRIAESDVAKLRIRSYIPYVHELLMMRNVVAQYLNSELGEDELAIAIQLIRRTMNFNRYFKMAFQTMLQAFENTEEVIPLVESNVLLRPGRGPNRTKLEKCEFVETLQWEFILVSRSVQDGKEQYRTATLHYFEDSLAWLEVRGKKKPFDATGHFPISAGCDTSGKERFIALVASPLDMGKMYFAYVTDGSRTVTFVDWDDNLRVEENFYVLVLQYDPSDVRHPILHVPVDAVHQTGPIYWTNDEEIDMDSMDDDSELPDFYFTEFLEGLHADGGE